jgi:hypothetical protein
MLVKTVNDMISEILSTIFMAEYRRLGNWIDRLCHQNAEAYGDPTLQGFVHSGKVYKPVGLKVADHQVNRRGLHHSLLADMDAYQMDLSILTRDKQFIQQALLALLDPCQDLQDVRDALPNCLASTLECIKGKDRGVRPEAYTLADNPRAKRQYEKILPRIEMYAVTRLIY